MKFENSKYLDQACSLIFFGIKSVQTQNIYRNRSKGFAVLFQEKFIGGSEKITLQTNKLGDFLFTLFRVTLQLNESIKFFGFKINIARVIQYWYIRSIPSEATYSTRKQQKTDLTIPKWRTQLTTFPRITEMFESEN